VSDDGNPEIVGIKLDAGSRGGGSALEWELPGITGCPGADRNSTPVRKLDGKKHDNAAFPAKSRNQSQACTNKRHNNALSDMAPDPWRQFKT